MLAQKMANFGIDNNLIRWTQSFLSDKLVELVIDKFISPREKVETRIS